MRHVEVHVIARPRRRGTARRSRAALLALAALAGAEPLRAQSADSAAPFPVRMLDRPTTLPKGAFRVDVFALGSETPGSSFATTGILGGGWGLTSSFEVGGQLVPVTFSPDVEYTTPSLYALHQFALSASATVAPMLQTVIPVRSDDPFIIDVGAAISVNLGQWGSFTSSPTFSLNTRQGGDGTSLSFPLTVMRQASERFVWQLSTGVGFSRFDPRFGLSRRFDPLDFDDVTVPASAQIAYTVPRNGTGNALVDIIVQWQFPQLYTSGPEESGWQPDDWTIQLQSSWYFVKVPRSTATSTSARGR